MKKKSTKEIFFTTAIHGNEKNGVNALKNLEKKGFIFDWILANKKGYEKNIRFVDTDLNRAFPGNDRSEKYEDKIAVKILKKAKQYKYLIDIHGADSPTGVFIILSNPTKKNIYFSGMFESENIVLWPNKAGAKTGALNGFVDCGLEIECGPKENKDIERKLNKILENFLENFEQLTIDQIKTNLKNKNYYTVNGKLEKSKDGQIIKSFQPFEYKKQTFFALLEDQYEGFKCYKMKKLSFKDINKKFSLDI